MTTQLDGDEIATVKQQGEWIDSLEKTKQQSKTKLTSKKLTHLNRKNKDLGWLMVAMLELAQWLFLVLIVIQFIFGNLVNGFLGLVNGRSWFKSKRIPSSDFLITSLALFRIILLWITFIDGVILVFFSDMRRSGVLMQVTDIFWRFVNHMSISLITCLGVLYCLKIANFSHPIFLWLKWRVSRVIVWMLLGALLLSCASSVSLIDEFNLYSDFSGIDSTGNMTEYFRKKRLEYYVLHVLGNLWNLPPLTVSLLVYFLLLFSLGRHTQQMQQNSINCSTEAHRRATGIICSFLFFFLLYFLSFLIFSWGHFLPHPKMSVMIGEGITLLYIGGHSFFLILGNKKLKQAFLAIFLCKSGHLKPRSPGSFCP